MVNCLLLIKAKVNLFSDCKLCNFQVTLRSANITNLPDRGVRLQMKLKQQEARLRDLRYQQGTLSNEVIKLESKLCNT